MGVRDEWVIDGYLQQIAQDICACVKNEFPETSHKLMRAALGYFHCTIFNEIKGQRVLTFQLFRDHITIDPVPPGYPGVYRHPILEDPDGGELLCAFILDNYLALA